MARLVDKQSKRAQLAEAAGHVFAHKGVSKTTVGDIVKAAGVAQGTFYLYFSSKDDAVLAVVELVVDRMLAGIADVVGGADGTAVERFLRLRDVLVTFDAEPDVAELAEFLHRPENVALHDRLAEHLMPRLLPLVETIVEQGVAEGAFDVPDTRAASWFVLGGLHSAELAGTPVADMPAAIEAATQLALRALGWKGDAR